MYFVLNTATPADEEKSGLPSSGADVYYVPNQYSLGVENMSDLPSGDEIVKSNIAVATTDKHAFIPTLGDVIELIPFLPVEINIPNVISSMMNFFNWMVNRRPQDQTKPRIYLSLKNHHGFGMYPFNVKISPSVFPYNQPSHGALTARLLLPAYRTHAV
jgi:hypothetical protein